ncbi:MAG: hypothetical protein PF588_10585, partial [Candidatus Kapabacteria bacterium]|nr:hypothetical protein [Candidatus Kapabacteria bacterium]
FEKKEFVGVQGDMAVRGGILDIWPIGWENPLRVEFWGDENESIREFNSMSQRSITQHDSVEFIAAVLSSSQTETNSTIKDYLSDDYIFVIDSADIIISENNDFEFPDEGQTIFFNKLGDTDVQIQSHAQPQFNGSIKHFSEELVKLSASNLMTVLCAEGKIHSERFRDLVENRMEEIINPEYFEILSH